MADKRRLQISGGESRGVAVRAVGAFCKAVIVLTLIADLSLAQKPRMETAEPTFRAQSEIVLVPFHVTIGNRYVEDLNRADIVLLEDGQPRQFDIFEGPATQHRVPIELVLLFDTNAARHSNQERGVNEFWNPARIYSFVRTWNELMSAQLLEKGGVDVRASVYRFNESGLERLCPSTSAPEEVLAGLQHVLQPLASLLRIPIAIPSNRRPKIPLDNDESREYWPYESAIGTLRDTHEASNVLRHMVIFSEGLSRTTTTPEDVAEVARAFGVSIFPVVLDYAKAATLTADPDHDKTRTDRIARFSPGTLSAMAEFARLGSLTGGRSFAPDDLDSASLLDILQSVKNAAITQYVAGFELPPRDGKGRGHKLEVRLVSKSRGKLTGGKRTVPY